MMLGRAKIEHGKDAGRPDIGNIGELQAGRLQRPETTCYSKQVVSSEDAARRRFAAVRAHETFGTEH